MIFAAAMALLLSADVSLDDLGRFPDAQVAHDQRIAWRERAALLAAHAPAEPFAVYREPWLEAAEDAWERCRAWETLQQAQNYYAEPCWPEETLRTLRLLRQRIGDDAYRRGEMPAAPLARMSRPR